MHKISKKRNDLCDLDFDTPRSLEYADLLYTYLPFQYGDDQRSLRLPNAYFMVWVLTPKGSIIIYGMGWQVTEILITLASHIIYAWFYTTYYLASNESKNIYCPISFAPPLMTHPILFSLPLTTRPISSPPNNASKICPPSHLTQKLKVPKTPQKQIWF